MNICILGDAQSIHVARIVAGLVARGLSVHVITHRPAILEGATVERYAVPRASLANPRGWRGRRDQMLRDLFRRFDVVHVHFLHDWGLTPEMIAEGCLVATPWGSDVVAPPGEAIAGPELVQTRKELLQHAACVTAWGPRFAQRIAEFSGLDGDEIALLPLGVDLSLFCPSGGDRVCDAAAPVVGFFKGFREVYGAEYLIRAMPRVLGQVPGVRFCLIGDDPRREECQELAVSLDVNAAIEWLPRHAHHELPAQIERWRVSVIPSVAESFGAAALESSAMCVPVVASRVGGLPDAVRHGETGMLVTPCDPGSLADAVVALLRNEMLGRRMGLAGRAFVEGHYEWNGILDRWVETYAAARERSAVMV